MTPLQSHLARFPKARASTLAYLIDREKVHAKLEAEIEAEVDRIISASFRTFAVNTIRAFKAGRI